MGSFDVDPEATGDDFAGGWDNVARLVDTGGGRWVERSPRFPDRAPQLRREAELLPWLAPLLPLPVPVPEIVSQEPLTVRYAYLPGGPCPGTSAVQGAAIGRFLRVLHTVDTVAALRHGARDQHATHTQLVETLDLMRREVLPLLPERRRSEGGALLTRVAVPPPHACLVHGDLGPEHIRVRGEKVTGVIDWGDSCLGDPALDLAWTTLGSSRAFGRAVVAAYRPDDLTRQRARDWHLLGPWHEVLYGLGEGGAAFVASGLAGVLSRLDAESAHGDSA